MSGRAESLRKFRDHWQPIVLACLIGVAGGWAASSLRLPLGWLLGAMFSTGILAVAGVRLRMPKQLRMIVMSIIGVYLGASFSPEVLGWLERSIITVLGMFVTVALMTALASLVMCKALRCDAVTALTSCVPGGFSSMLLFARHYGGDEEIVAMVHTVRMVMVIVVFSFALHELGVTAGAQQQEMLPSDIGYAFAMGAAGLLVGGVTRMPILCLFLPMCLGAFTQMGSFTRLELSSEPLIFALVVLGTLVGSQWRTLKGRKLISCLVAGLLLGVFFMVTFACAAIGMAQLLEFDKLPVVLAMSPGGIAEISLIAVAFNIEPAFVVLHQLLRVLFILLALPFVFGALRNLSGGKVLSELQKSRGR